MNVRSLTPYMNRQDNDEIKLSDDSKRSLIEICAEALRRGTQFDAKMVDNLKALPVCFKMGVVSRTSKMFGSFCTLN